MNLEGRVSLVTGGARRLGRAIALALAHRGSDVAISYHTSAEEAAGTVREIERGGRRGAAFPCDVRSEEDVARLVESVVDSLGPIDVLVVNAAAFLRTPLDQATEAEWHELFEVNAHGAFRCAQKVAARMKDRGGAIVFIADVAGLRPWPAYIPYSASKASVIAITQGLAAALAPAIRVNAVAPGPVLPPESFDEEAVRSAAARTLLGRTGTPADVADAVVYLATADYVTGAVLPVDGGRHLR